VTGKMVDWDDGLGSVGRLMGVRCLLSSICKIDDQAEDLQRFMRIYGENQRERIAEKAKMATMRYCRCSNAKAGHGLSRTTGSPGGKIERI
jgi:hypothetical protein